MAELALILLFAVWVGLSAWCLSNDPGDDPWIEDPDDDDNDDVDGEWIAAV